MSNRLADETSPYLLQHADNPVDWYPWGEEAFEAARAADRPILLSIGYSACHWCHVMERESFEDPETAALMNELFVSVKVDREERPDVDNIYMQAVQAMSGHGGWPLTAFLTPAGEPYFGGTYFPPVPRHGMPSFREVLSAARAAYDGRREQVERTAAQLREAIHRAAERGRDAPEAASLDEAGLAEALQRIARAFDPNHGGFGGAPKFPQPVVLEFLLRHQWRTGDPQALSMAVHTLRRMAAGGMRDHLGGGFHRYSVDARWLVPHFEKMLYDNALLATAYVHGHLHTGAEDLRAVAEATLDYVLDDLTSPEGGFYSARDADSEGEEGRFYVWTPDEVDRVLGEAGPLFRRVYDVSEVGNFEGRSILHLPHDPEAIARSEGMGANELHERLDAARAKLLAARRARPEPFRDEKILASWSALTIRALARAAGGLERADYRDVARRAAHFLLESMRDADGLKHTYKDGVSKVPGMLADVAALGNALLDLYLVDPEPAWIDDARWAAEEVLAKFWDPDTGLAFDTPSDGEALIVRPRDLQDGALPSGQSLAAELLLRLGALLGEERYQEVGGRVLGSVPDAARHPLAFAYTLAVAETRVGPPLEVALVGERADPAWGRLHQVITTRYLPGVVFAAGMGDDRDDALPLLAGKRTVEGAPAAYVCWHHTCSPPVTDPAALAALLDRLPSSGLDAHGDPG